LIFLEITNEKRKIDKEKESTITFVTSKKRKKESEKIYFESKLRFFSKIKII
jgi:hypothetical protein